MITFLWPFVFILFPLPYLLRRLVPPAAPGTEGALHVPFFAALASSSAGGGGHRRRSLWRMVLASVIWLLLVTALARPALVGPQMPLPAQGRDVMMAIDLSGSMGREDFAVNGRASTRLGVVKEAADAFIARRKGDRVGLILFSNRAYLQAPLTFDRRAVRALLDEAQVGLTGQQTAIGDAIAVAVKRLKDRPKGGRVLILLTDGANNAGVMQPLEAAKLAKKLGIRIYTIGVGANAMRVNTAFGQRIVNPSQDLDEPTLEKIAQTTGGKYFRATDVKGLAKVYRAIDALEPVSGEPLYVRPTVSLYFWPAGLALVLTALFALLLGAPRLRQRLTRRPREGVVQ
ncbi:VWA domain-containing protein [Aquicoccus sp. G2-2]|uniref:vWA domain-containing protein n=1 Tax=Aquicoccus sp. G2-2 TaxID=3092120 RepID=UPI002AE0B068|nr:VWA domain-containing protein [Aquicoccus sp. G2-2]MEA1114855.1 VWA domain-containing protein [Aquicoccus sp. G2-2]